MISRFNRVNRHIEIDSNTADPYFTESEIVLQSLWACHPKSLGFNTSTHIPIVIDQLCAGSNNASLIDDFLHLSTSLANHSTCRRQWNGKKHPWITSVHREDTLKAGYTYRRDHLPILSDTIPEYRNIFLWVGCPYASTHTITVKQIDRALWSHDTSWSDSHIISHHSKATHRSKATSLQLYFRRSRSKLSCLQQTEHHHQPANAFGMNVVTFMYSSNRRAWSTASLVWNQPRTNRHHTSPGISIYKESITNSKQIINKCRTSILITRKNPLIEYLHKYYTAYISSSL